MKRFLVLCVSAVAVAALSVILLVNMPVQIVYNGSASAPVGFYRISDEPVPVGDRALVRLPEQMQKLVSERRYLPPDLPLIKRVAARSGDKICRKNQNIFINRHLVARALKVDSEGRDMPVWSGCLSLREDEVFLLQDHPRSFDGRYFGPVDQSLIIGRATKVWPRLKTPCLVSRTA